MSEEAEVNNEETAEGEEKQEQQQQQTDAIEERARTMGWIPEEDFRGDKEKWVDAETFVKRGQEINSVLRERYDKLEHKYIELESTLKKFADHHKNVSEREYKRALEDIRKQKAEAVSLGDAAAYAKAEAQEDQLRDSKPEAIEVPDSADIHPDWPTWVAENKWYETDIAAQAVADRIAQQLARSNPNLQGRALFDAVKERVKEELPHKFENPRRKQASAVEGAGGGKAKSKGKTYDDLPKDAKEACDSFVRQKLMTKEQYVKEYDWS